MASIGTNLWGIVITLDHNETQQLANSEDAAAAVTGLVGAGLTAYPYAALIVAACAAYVSVEKDMMLLADQGAGVFLTLPWLAIFSGNFWMIVASPRPTTQPVAGAVNGGGTITVRRSNGQLFQPNEDWSHGPCYGSRGTFFADVDGDGKAEVILVNDDTITVRRSTGHDFGASFQVANEDWSHGPCYGSRGTFFADVDGDGKAECILVNDDTITVRRSTGHDFGPSFQVANENWSHGPCYGSRGTFFADVDGDGRADCILVNDNTITVRRSTGRDFGASSQVANEDWSHGACYGSRGTFFADVDGDRKADCILVNDNTITVRRSTGHDFGASSQIANEDWSHGPCYGNLGTYFADVTGDGKADCVLVNNLAGNRTVTIRRSTGHDFGGSAANEDWTRGAYFGNKGTFFADVTGDGKADAIVVNG